MSTPVIIKDGTGSGYEVGVTSSNALKISGAGTAGNPDSGIITIQGYPTGTPIKVDIASITASSGSLFNSTFPVDGTAIGFIDINGKLQGSRVYNLNTGGTEFVLGVNLRRSGGSGSIEIGTSSNPIRIDPTGTTVQPVSQNGTWTVQPGNTSNTTPWLITIQQDGYVATVTNSNALKVDGSAVTQPISGTITANAGSGTFAINGSVSQSGTWTVQPGNTANTTPWLTTINQGGNSVSVKAASTPPSVTDPALVVAISPNSTINTSTDGYVTTSSPTYTNNSYQPLSLTTDGALRVDGSSIIQPVSGTVTSNQGTSASLSGAWPIKITDGTSTVGITTVGAEKALKVDVIKSVESGGGGGVGTGGTSSNFDDPFPAAGTAVGFFDGYAMRDAYVYNLNPIGTEYAIGVSLRKIVSGGSVELGTSTNPIRIDPSGTTDQPVSGKTAINAAPTTNPVFIAGWDGSNIQAINVDSSGAVRLQSSGTTGSAAPSRAVQMGGSDGTNLRALRTASDGTLRIDPSGTTTQPVSIIQGGNTATVKPASTAALATDPALVVTISPNSSSNTYSDGYVTTSAPSYDNNTYQSLSLTTSGGLRTDVGSWLGSIAPTVGQKTAVNSIPVIIASDQSSIPVTSSKSSTAILTNVSASVTSVTILASNSSRVGAIIVNESVVPIYLAFAATASQISYSIILEASDSFNIPFGYTGVISGIWRIATGSARVTELT